VNTSGMLEEMRDAGGDVIGVDWRIEIDSARRRLGDRVALQGNLDPVALLAPWERLRPRAQHVLDQMGARAGYVFNLGHGVLPQTPVENVQRLVEFVHEYSASSDANAD
jgi:uroporphyrinogen decarboxylase